MAGVFLLVMTNLEAAGNLCFPATGPGPGSWPQFVFTGLGTQVIFTGSGLPPYCWFSLSNSETAKAVALTYCSIQLYLITDIGAKCCIPSLS